MAWCGSAMSAGLLLLGIGAACDGASQPPPRPPAGPTAEAIPRVDDQPWVVTRETEGATTTVVNASGSKWGGAAALREELSIGVEAGEDPYMFGSVISVWATDEHVYVVDAGVRVVRVFDTEGNYVRDVGSVGQGPGEYQSPMGIAVASDGRILVLDRQQNGVIVYAPDGTYLDQWGWESRVYSSSYIVLGFDDTPWVNASVYLNPERPWDSPNRRRAMWALGPGGRIGDPFLFPAGTEECAMFADNEVRSGLSVPFCPTVVSALTPSGALVSGYGDQYRFEVVNPDGTKVVVRRDVDLVPVLDDERRFRERWTTLQMQGWEPGWRWDGPPIPETKPAFRAFYPDRSNRVMVRREGPSHALEGCDQRPNADEIQSGSARDCWAWHSLWDMFDLNGDYLGEILRPGYSRMGLMFAKDDLFYFVVEDDYGTQFVKRFRLILPES